MKSVKISLALPLIGLLTAIMLLCGTAGPAQALEAAHREVLPNGVTLLVTPTLASPTVSVNIFVKMGSFEEGAEINGISHFYEHLFFRGTPRWPGYQFKRHLEAIGGSTNANTGRDMTHFFVNVPKQKAVEAVEMMADAFVNAELEPVAIEQERKAVLEEYGLGADNAQRLVHDRMYLLAYGADHPYGLPVIGNETNLRSFKRDDFLRFRETFYTPGRTTVAIIGDLSLREILPVARRCFGQFHRSHGERPLRQAANRVAPAQTVEATMDFNIKNTLLMLGFPGPSVHDRPDIYRMDVAAFLLGIGRGSIIERDVVAKEKALSAGVDFLTQRFSGLAVLYSITKPGGEDVAREALLAAVQRLKDGDISERDLLRAKNFLKSNFNLGNESNAGKAESLGFYTTIGEPDFPKTYCQHLDEVSVADVAAVANKYFTDSYYAVTMSHSEPKVKRHSKLDDYDPMGRRIDRRQW